MPKVKDSEIKNISTTKRLFIADLKKVSRPATAKSSPKHSKT